MKPRPLTVQLPDEVTAALTKQSDHLGLPSANQWSAMILTTISRIDPAQAMIVLGKIQTLPAKSRNPRLSDL